MLVAADDGVLMFLPSLTVTPPSVSLSEQARWCSGQGLGGCRSLRGGTSQGHPAVAGGLLLDVSRRRGT